MLIHFSYCTYTRICDITKMVNYHSLMGLSLGLIILRRCQTRAAYNENELQRFWHFSSRIIFFARERALLRIIVHADNFGANIIAWFIDYSSTNWIWYMKHPFMADYLPLIKLNVVENFFGEFIMWIRRAKWVIYCIKISVVNC